MYFYRFGSEKGGRCKDYAIGGISGNFSEDYIGRSPLSLPLREETICGIHDRVPARIGLVSWKLWGSGEAKSVVNAECEWNAAIAILRGGRRSSRELRKKTQGSTDGGRSHSIGRHTPTLPSLHSLQRSTLSPPSDPQSTTQLALLLPLPAPLREHPQRLSDCPTSLLHCDFCAAKRQRDGLGEEGALSGDWSNSPHGVKIGGGSGVGLGTNAGSAGEARDVPQGDETLDLGSVQSGVIFHLFQGNPAHLGAYRRAHDRGQQIARHIPRILREGLTGKLDLQQL
ncbi:unnamed protein product [Sphagnum balticum]